MPDLNLIKQGEQGVRDLAGVVRQRPVGQSRCRPRGRRDYVNRVAGLLLAGALAMPTVRHSISWQPRRASDCRGGGYRR
jgi:hypothetical protein